MCCSYKKSDLSHSPQANQSVGSPVQYPRKILNLILQKDFASLILVTHQNLVILWEVLSQCVILHIILRWIRHSHFIHDKCKSRKRKSCLQRSQTSLHINKAYQNECQMFLWQNFRQVCIVLEKKLCADNPVEPSCHSELFVFVAISFSNFWALLYFCIIVFCICLGEPWDNPVKPNCHFSLLAGLRDFSFSTENCKLSNSHWHKHQYV